MEHHSSEKFEAEAKGISERLRERPIDLLPEHKDMPISELRAQHPDGMIAACDFYVADIEKDGRGFEAGFEKEGVWNFDHHAPVEDMARMVSSANLVIDYVTKSGPVPKEWHVVLNHTDCDSALSSSILRGILSPDEKFGRAAIAADHTGDADDIADLLQAVAEKRDLEFSLRNLTLLMERKPLEPEAAAMLEKRRKGRAAAGEMAQKFFRRHGRVAYVKLAEKVESELFLPFVPDAEVILVAHPSQEFPDKWVVTIRLGKKGMEEGLNLNDLNISEIDPAFGNRWNAGANNRGGGTALDPEEYAKKLDERLKKIH